jgi:hypothetical protein
MYNSDTKFLTSPCLWTLFYFKRKNRYRGRKTPVEILEESESNISPQVFNLPPIILDNYLKGYIKSGYHVGSSDNTFKFFS